MYHFSDWREIFTIILWEKKKRKKEEETKQERTATTTTTTTDSRPTIPPWEHPRPPAAVLELYISAVRNGVRSDSFCQLWPSFPAPCPNTPRADTLRKTSFLFRCYCLARPHRCIVRDGRASFFSGTTSQHIRGGRLHHLWRLASFFPVLHSNTCIVIHYLQRRASLSSTTLCADTSSVKKSFSDITI